MSIRFPVPLLIGLIPPARWRSGSSHIHLPQMSSSFSALGRMGEIE
jgi:hypothetical protein